MAADENKPAKDGWDKFQAFSGLITGVVVALVGWFLTDSVNHAFHRSELQFSYVKEMQELLAKLGDPAATADQARTVAVALAAYGSYSIPPLINEMESNQSNRQEAGEYGLRTVALADPAATCPTLARILQNRTAAYNWFTHRAAIHILGAANCQNSRTVLTEYQSQVNAAASSSAALAAFKARLADAPPVTPETIDELHNALEKTMKLLDQGRMQE